MPTLINKMPLPKVLSDNAPCGYRDGMHAGLFYCRFVRGWHPFGEGENGQPKPLSFSSYGEEINGKKRTVTPAKEWVEKLHNKTVGDSEMLSKFINRQSLFMQALKGQSFPAKTEWHFVTGLGNDHPVENGLAWHPTLGVPYLTGAAVKGLLRGWCEQWAGFEDDKLRLWFGPSLDELNPKKDSGTTKQNPAAGELIFFDALPTNPVRLKADVMTPHYGKWYAEGDKPQNEDGSNVPADWHNPVPVPFLVVAPEQRFQFSVATRSNSVIAIGDVMKQLKLALRYLGAGAKTAVGYGRMSNPEDDARAWLERIIDELRNDKDFKGQPEETLWKKALSERYLSATSETREWALPMIREQWKALGIDWSNPKGNSAQSAKQNFTR